MGRWGLGEGGSRTGVVRGAGPGLTTWCGSLEGDPNRLVAWREVRMGAMQCQAKKSAQNHNESLDGLGVSMDWKPKYPCRSKSVIDS